MAAPLIYGLPSPIKLHAPLIQNQRAKNRVLQITPSSPYMSILCDWSEIISAVQDHAAAAIGRAQTDGSLPDPAFGMVADSLADTRQINHIPAPIPCRPHPPWLPLGSSAQGPLMPTFMLVPPPATTLPPTPPPGLALATLMPDIIQDVTIN